MASIFSLILRMIIHKQEHKSLSESLVPPNIQNSKSIDKSINNNDDIIHDNPSQ